MNVTFNRSVFAYLISMRADSLKVYCHSLAAFLTFLGSSATWLRHLRMTANQMAVLVNVVKQVAKSLKQDILVEQVER